MEAAVRQWLARDPDPDTRRELEQLVARGDQEEIARRFSGRLAFGTAGLRGLVGAGPNRMNRLVVRETSAGLGRYLLATVPGAAAMGVVVGHDARHKSRLFAEETAGVLAGLGIRVHLFERETPTPVCAFAVRDLGAAAGVVITASHNPPEYNGYKVYWANGAQIIPPHDTGIAARIGEAAAGELPRCDLAQARRRGLVRTLGDETARRYLEGVRALSVHEPGPARATLPIAYTPMHGVGARFAEAALAAAGFRNVHTVAAQREPDPDFPTVRFPNPEEPGAMELLLALARKTEAVIACANDPDADRLAAAVRTAAGDYLVLSGDQVGVLLGADLMARAPATAVVGSTVVSSRLLGVMARARGVGYYETLTGFKWITNVGMQHERRGARVLFGYEEALGYTIGGLVRDKDGISALQAFAELAADCQERGTTLLGMLESIYRAHGLYLTRQKSLTLDPRHRGPSAGELLRQSPPEAIAGLRVESVTDLRAGSRRLADGREERVDLPPSDVLVYLLAGGSRVVVRPSGTEPKLKCYYEVIEKVTAQEELTAAETRATRALDGLVDGHQEELRTLTGLG